MKDSVVNFLTVLVVVIGVIVWLYKKNAPVQAEQPIKQVQQPYQRFVPIPRESGLAGVPWSGAFALDTKTGQLCATYETTYSGRQKNWENLPLCSYLALPQ